MDPPKHQVSLRGSSSKEITRNALLEKVSQERELRNFARRANAAAIFIQRVWRRYSVTLRVALELQEDWNISLRDASGRTRKMWISCCLLRPFLFFITHVFARQRIIQTKAVNSMHSCFLIVLENIDSSDANINFCSLATGETEEQMRWSYQIKKLVSLCSYLLASYKRYSCSKDVATVTALLLRMIVILTDTKGWKCMSAETHKGADRAVKDVVKFMGSDKSGLCRCVGKYIDKLNAPPPTMSDVQRDENFVITASAITLVLRPFQAFTTGEVDLTSCTKFAAEQYCLYILSVPWLVQQIPVVLMRALRHSSTLAPCLTTLMVMADYA